MSSKLYRKSLVGLILVLHFFLAPAHAAPSLSLGTTAKYNVSIILHISNGCTSDPIEYAGQACNPIIYYRPPGVVSGGYLNIATTFSVPSSFPITIYDHGACASAGANFGF